MGIAKQVKRFGRSANHSYPAAGAVFIKLARRTPNARHRHGDGRHLKRLPIKGEEMKTEFLKGLGLEQSVIDQIMAENGKDVNAEKEKAKAAQEQLADVQGKLKAFDGVDVNDLKGKITQLTTDLAKKDTDYQQKLADIEFARTLESAIAGTKPRSVKAVMAMLDTDALKASKNQQADITAALEAVKKDNDYLFEPGARISSSTPGPKDPPPEKGSTAEANAALRSLFGKGD